MADGRKERAEEMRVFGVFLLILSFIFGMFVNWILATFIGIIGVILIIVGKGAGDKKVCPKCAEKIKKEALVCRFCGFEFPKPDPKRPRDAGRRKYYCPKCGLSYSDLEQNEDGKYYCPKCAGKPLM
jgi:DNA-directed RNA polymerase subunit RPC12/RpoP